MNDESWTLECKPYLAVSFDSYTGAQHVEHTHHSSSVQSVKYIHTAHLTDR
jgi:hypothetical protein